MYFMIIWPKVKFNVLLHSLFSFPLTLCPSLVLWCIYFSSFIFFLILSVLYSFRIGIVLARYQLRLNLSLQGLCANNPSLSYWRKSICGSKCFLFCFFPRCVPPITETLLHAGMLCICILVNHRCVVIEQVLVAVSVGCLHRQQLPGEQRPVGNMQHQSCGAHK